ncbi:methyltransferase domain-containing protein [Acidimicrobiaceae bacterium]|nr:methyltransferase domain-containing protein [Acidimicrobiaceae bacterium]
MNGKMENNFNNFESNEYIGEGKDPFIDDRGKILNYYLNNKVNQVGLIDSKRGSVRGNHYHPDQLQTCILIKGSYISVTKNLEDDNDVIESRLIKEGEISIIKPNIAHTMVFIEDSVFINLVDGEREHENYGETHTFPLEIVDNFLAESIVECFKDNCRVCNSRNLILIHSFGLSPLANNLVENKKSNATTYPLELNYCKDCNNIQLSIVVDPKILFDKYLYTSSTSQSFVDHFTELASNLIKEFNLGKESVVVDIGSNDGIFLKPLVDRNIKSIGVEPATNLAIDANKNNLETINSYFDKKVVESIIQKYGKVDIVTAFNVFAHSDKLKDLANDAFSLLKKDGVFIIEVQSLAEMIEKNLFDNVYHEHVNYWSLTNLVSFFEKLGFFVNNFQKVETHGGSLRLFISRKKKIKSAVSEYIKYEENLGLNQVDTFYSFSKKIIEQKNLALENINNLKKSGKKIIFYGAPAKATTLLNYYGINSKLVQFTIEDNPLKVGKYIPNTNIEIIDKERAIKLDPDVIIVLAWNFYEVIKKDNQDIFPNAEFLKLDL